jgi:hypothetical protein
MSLQSSGFLHYKIIQDINKIPQSIILKKPDSNSEIPIELRESKNSPIFPITHPSTNNPQFKLSHGSEHKPILSDQNPKEEVVSVCPQVSPSPPFKNGSDESE